MEVSPSFLLWALLFEDPMLKAAAWDHEKEKNYVEKSTWSSDGHVATVPDSVLM